MRALLAAFVLWSTAAGAQVVLPEGKGKAVVESVCTECHTLDRVVQQRLTEEGWRGILEEMAENGATFNPEDITTVLAYLTKNLPPRKVNVNQATAREIATVLKLTSVEADEIVKRRTENGKFRDIDDLKKIKDLEQKIEAARDLIEF